LKKSVKERNITDWNSDSAFQLALMGIATPCFVAKHISTFSKWCAHTVCSTIHCTKYFESCTVEFFLSPYQHYLPVKSYI